MTKMNNTMANKVAKAMNDAAANDVTTNKTSDELIARLVKENENLKLKLEGRSDQKNNQRLWDESHKPVSRFVIDDEDGYVTVREVIDSANGEVELSKEKFSYSDLKSLAVDKTVEWKHKKQNSEAKDFVKSFASSFATSFLMSYGISALIKGLSKKR